MAAPGTEAAIDAAVGVRQGSKLRAVLGRLSNANRQRYANAEVQRRLEAAASATQHARLKATIRECGQATRQTASKPSQPRPIGFVALPPMPDRLLAEEREIVRFTVRELAAVDSDASPLTEDEIVAILAGE